MKFEFELENPEDVDNLWRLFHDERMHMWSKALDGRTEGMPQTAIDCMIARIHYLDELEAIVFSKPVEYTDVGNFLKGDI